MGLAGLGLAWRGAAAALPLPAAAAAGIGAFWILLGAAALAGLLPAYALKLLRHPGAVREEFAEPARLGFCATLPLGMTLVAGGLQPWAAPLAEALWWPGVAGLVALQLRMSARVLRGGLTLADVNGGWMIVFIGGIVVPASGLPLGHPEVSALCFGLSAAVAPFVMGAVLCRAAFGPPLPDPARPGWFILLVPPGILYADGVALSGQPAGLLLQGLLLFGVVLMIALLTVSRRCFGWPFGAPWWAFTFPLDGMAAAALRQAADHPAAGWQALAAALLLLATAAACVVLARTLAALARGTLLAAEAPRGP
jgi:tellurite resistance protein